MASGEKIRQLESQLRNCREEKKSYVTTLSTSQSANKYREKMLQEENFSEVLVLTELEE